MAFVLLDGGGELVLEIVLETNEVVGDVGREGG